MLCLNISSKTAENNIIFNNLSVFSRLILVTRTRKKIIGLEGFGLKIKKQEIIKWKKKLKF